MGDAFDTAAGAASTTSMGPSLPMALALVVCDAIWIDPGTGKKTILGTFSAFFGRQFPLTVPQIGVYVALTDARGKVALKLRLVDVDELREPVKEHEFEVDFKDPIMIAEGVLHFLGPTFPEEGEYRLQLVAEGELIMERRIVLMPVQPEQRA